MGVFLMLYVLVWMTTQLVTHPNLDPYGDMLEHFAWGQTFAWGQAKHPPLIGWVTAAWFDVMPRSLVSYFLLAYTNAALGLAGIFALGKIMGLERIRAGAVLLAVLALPYCTLAGKFNANAILLSVWPWIAVAWLASIKHVGWKSFAYAALLGLLAAVGLLGKYYTGVLLAALGFATLLSSDERKWLLRPQPYLALALLLLFLTPHALWLKDNSFITFAYVQAQGSGSIDVEQLLKFALAPFGFWFIAYIAVLCCVPASERQRFSVRSFWQAWMPKGRDDLLFWLCALPYLISLLFGLSGFVSLSSPWAIPLGFGFSLLWLRNLTEGLNDSMVSESMTRIQNTFLGFLCLVLLIGPVYAWHQGRTLEKNYYLPTEEAVYHVEALWLDSFREDYHWVAGDYPYVAAVVFYGSVDAEILSTMPHRPSSSGLILCHLGPVDTGKTESLCTARVERWSADRQAQLLTMEFTVARAGPRFFAEVPHLYRVYFYDHLSTAIRPLP